MNVKDKIMDYLNILEDDRFKKWEEVVTKYPKMGLTAWFEGIIKLAPKRMKDPLSSHTKEIIDKAVAEQRDENQRMVSLQVHICIFDLTMSDIFVSFHEHHSHCI